MDDGLTFSPFDQNKQNFTVRTQPIYNEEEIKSETNWSTASSISKLTLKKSTANSKTPTVASKPEPVSSTKTTLLKKAIKKELRSTKPVANEKNFKSEIAKVESKDVKQEPGTEEYKWWKSTSTNTSNVNWTTLSHNGVLFPPPYTALPKTVYLIYDGKRVRLPIEAEEVAGFFGAMIETDHAKNKTFQKNFFQDFCVVLKEINQDAIDLDTNKAVKILDFSKCDFSVMHRYFESQREKNKHLSALEKQQIKAEKEALEAKYKFCIMDGRKENVGNFRIEPPGLFRGRGDHPKTGKLKRRVRPEDVTINVGKEAQVPASPKGHKWGGVEHNAKVAWLAKWKENINGAFKYVLLSDSSSLKGLGDLKKYEKARDLKRHIERIRQNYQKDLYSDSLIDRQRATAIYLIDKLALRVGGNKKQGEADTVGCCSLRCEHVSLVSPHTLVLDFLGKDSVPYHKEQQVDPQVYANILIFKQKSKSVKDQIFDRLTPSMLNKRLKDYMEGLTAKVFRTYNASYTMQQELNKIENTGTVNEKIARYNAANHRVAVLCNHQKAIDKSHDSAIEKMQEQTSILKWKRSVLEQCIYLIDPKPKNSKGEYFFADMSEFSPAALAKIIKKSFDVERERTKVQYMQMTEREKVGEKISDKEKFTKKDYDEVVASIKIQEQEVLDICNQTKLEPTAIQTIEKMRAQVEKIDTQIKSIELEKGDKEDNLQVSLNTSKLNYIDPRLTVMFSKKYGVPIEELFGKSMCEKFKWAIETADENWSF